MSSLVDDERLQFFFRNREDIKAWAAIESDVMAATRELLARSRNHCWRSASWQSTPAFSSADTIAGNGNAFLRGTSCGRPQLGSRSNRRTG